jgi:thiamine pyrophosphokinase
MMVYVIAGGADVAPDAIEGFDPPDLVIAADSGADLAERLGLCIDVLIGDLDSISEEAHERAREREVEIRAYPSAKDATDLELAMDAAIEVRATDIVVIGGAGGRLDHHVGNVALLGSRKYAVARVTWITGPVRSYVVRGTRHVPTSPGQLVSVIPMGGTARGVHLRGLRWPLAGATLRWGTTVGLSNEATGEEAVITVSDGTLLVVVGAEGAADR